MSSKFSKLLKYREDVDSKKGEMGESSRVVGSHPSPLHDI